MEQYISNGDTTVRKSEKTYRDGKWHNPPMTPRQVTKPEDKHPNTMNTAL